MSDIYSGQNKIPKIETLKLKELSVLKPWRSLVAILMDWAIIIMSILLCEWISYWFYPLAFVIIGSRFHGLEAMMHEATHFRIHQNRIINEFLGELSVWPLWLSLFLYREKRHFSHHRNIGTQSDSHIYQTYNRFSQRFNIPKPLNQLIQNCIIAAFSFPVEIWWRQVQSNVKVLPRLSRMRGLLWILFQITTILTIILGSIFFSVKVAWVYLLFIFLPLMWIAVFSRYLRLLSEHFGIPEEKNNLVLGAETRTVIVNWPIRVIFWPHNMNYHLEHHWYPSVPFYNLPALHKILKESPQARLEMHITNGVQRLIQELTTS
jgi:fatty acid desaturase